ncbi:MAG TPA: hypothetical protein VGD63_10515, partial [Steroidobacteraceae bacterium]
MSSKFSFCQWPILIVGTFALAAPYLGRAAVDTSTAVAPNAALEEIVVTAQKRSENLQSVPVAVTAFTAETRDLIGIES